MRVSNWGNYPTVETDLRTPVTDKAAVTLTGESQSLIARGQGRCYGDSSLHPRLILGITRLNRMLDFDAESGLLTAEAGVTLKEIMDAFVPRGWFLPVTPGTALVSLGGAMASDVHGKNHHVAGTFGQHVEWLDLLTAQNGVVRCSASVEPELFHATRGGHGLTGVILRVALRLCRIPSAWIGQTTVKAANLTEIMAAFDEYGASPYSVAWIDCLQKGEAMGRSILMYGDFLPAESLPGKSGKAGPFATQPKRALSVPFNAPSFALNSLSVKAFNALYYAKARKGRHDSTVPYTTFFHPLDAVGHWNRIYGKRGFTQYQFVIPLDAARAGLPEILGRIAKAGLGSFLAVLKLFGKQETYPGNISFPVEGYTLALDFPVSRALFPLLDELDRVVLDHGGRHYLTKDARMAPATFAKSYGNALDAFLAVKHTWDPDNKFTSSQAMRLGVMPGTGPAPGANQGGFV